MTTYQGYSPVSWARSASTTLAQHIRELEEEMLRNYQMGALIEANGRVLYNQAGEGFDWPVQFRLHNVEGNTGETARNFARTNLFKKASLEYRGYQATDAISRREFLANRGESAIVKLFDNFVERITTSVRQALGVEYYVDGSASGFENSWHGLESMFATNGTLNISAGTQRAANAADKVGFPNDTYAGIVTNLGNYGGENESGLVWPLGIAQSEYDFWTPLIVNYTSSAFGGAADTWAAQGDEAMRYAIIHSQRNRLTRGQISNIFLDRTLYMDFLNLIDGKEQINVTSQNDLRALGFKNVVVFDGVEVSWEVGVDDAIGYGININNVALMCMEDTLLKSEGPEYDMHTQYFNAVVGTISNLRFSSPRNFFKLMSLA
jgi:hypothetical protein